MAFLNKNGVERLWLHIISKLNGKVDKVEGKILSSNDYTTEEKEQLSTLNSLVGDTAVATQISEAISVITPEDIGALDEEDYYGIVKKEGEIVSAKSLDGLAISAISYITATQEGTGDPSPDNVRPISGWDAVSLSRTGRNLVNVPDYVDVHGMTIRAETLSAFSAVRYKPRTQYTLSAEVTVSDKTKWFGIEVEYEGSSAPKYYYLDGVNGTNRAVTTEAGKTIKRICYSFQSACTTTVLHTQLEEGTASTPYEPYRGKELSAALPETVYGGTLDWTTGLLTVTHAGYTLDGVTTKFDYISVADGYTYAYHKMQSRSRLHTDKLITSHLRQKWAVGYGNAYVAGQKEDDLFSYIKEFADVAEANDWLVQQAAAGTPYQICYDLAEPYTIQLTP